MKRTNIPGATQKLAQFEKLPIYSETAEVAKVLYDMLADLDARLSVLETVDSNAQVVQLNVAALNVMSQCAFI